MDVVGVCNEGSNFEENNKLLRFASAASKAGGDFQSNIQWYGQRNMACLEMRQ